ncbi:LysR family transcriptional regulator [Streptomyces bauhiniae]|uniref:LysR family transcriptional regulator n=1 Tax=Streptomyces bauhiniae TaxID=2340725 RepID=UPI0035E1F40E
MDLRQMAVVVAVAEEGGFSVAARRLHVVQSTVSATVRALERELGVPLFERTTHRVTLTSAGEAFVPAARAALRAADQARAAADAARGELTGRVTVGVMQGVWGGLERALGALRDRHPRVTVRLLQAAVADIRQMLREGSVDLAVVAFDRQQQRGLVTRLLVREEMMVVSSPLRDLPQPDKVAYREFEHIPFVDFSPGWAVRSAVDRSFRAAGAVRNSVFEVNDIVAAAELVRHDLGVCVMPASIAARFPDLVARRIAPRSPRWDVLVVRPAGEPSPAVAELMKMIR